MRIEIEKREINTAINGRNGMKIKERKGKKNGRKLEFIYIYI
tara:strand:- start:430 stop:555 length:126 start_codon:yes stop_codon:yes gene_type:complete